MLFQTTGRKILGLPNVEFVTYVNRAPAPVYLVAGPASRRRQIGCWYCYEPGATDETVPISALRSSFIVSILLAKLRPDATS
jgi:hypothetical protein